MRAIRVGTVAGGFVARTCSFALAAVHGLAWPDVPPVEKVRLADLSPERSEAATPNQAVPLGSKPALAGVPKSAEQP